jgi:hypothetical protein
MSGTHSIQWRNEEMLTKFCSENMKDNGYLGDLGINKKLILIDHNEVRPMRLSIGTSSGLL